MRENKRKRSGETLGSRRKKWKRKKQSALERVKRSSNKTIVLWRELKMVGLTARDWQDERKGCREITSRETSEGTEHRAERVRKFNSADFNYKEKIGFIQLLKWHAGREEAVWADTQQTDRRLDECVRILTICPRSDLQIWAELSCDWHF